jgi:hypothetical protein
MENKSFNNKENNLEAYWNSIRKRSADHSFPEMADWIREMHKNIGRSRLEKIKRRKKSRWFALAILPFFVILSCTIPVNRVEKSGSLVNIGVEKKEDRSFQKLSSLQQRFSFTCYEFLQPDQPAITFFIFFIPDKEQKKLQLITRELNTLTGLRKLDISSINYTIRESLFSTFLHKTLKLGNQQKQKGEELTRNIQATLKDKGLGFLSITILSEDEENIAFVPNRNLDSLTTINKKTLPGENKNPQNEKTRNTPVAVNKLQNFDWLLGSWKVKFVTQKTYHYWLRMDDSLLMCFIIKYKDEDLINYGDDGPDISVGFSIKYSNSDSAILSLRGIEWKFLSANDKEIRFRNEITPKSANVKWSFGNEKKTWQSAISGEGNLEVVNLIWDVNPGLENIVKGFIAKHRDIIKKTHD